MSIEEANILKELAITEMLVAALPMYSEERVTIVRPDPPDCSIANGTIGIELIELVDPTLADPRKHTSSPIPGVNAYREYSADNICQEITRILLKKDDKLHGAHVRSSGEWTYQQLLIFIYTDEFDITFSKAATAIHGLTIPELREITGAYLVLSYSPESKSYPTIQIF